MYARKNDLKIQNAFASLRAKGRAHVGWPSRARSVPRLFVPLVAASSACASLRDYQLQIAENEKEQNKGVTNHGSHEQDAKKGCEAPSQGEIHGFSVAGPKTFQWKLEEHQNEQRTLP